MKKMFKPGIYRITLTDSKGKKYEPEKPYETYRTVEINGVKKKEWRTFPSFSEAKAFHGSTAKKSSHTFREVWNHFAVHGMGSMEMSSKAKIMSQVRHLDSLMDTIVSEHTPKTVAEWLTDLCRPEYIQNLKGTRVSFKNELRLLKQIHSYYRENFDFNFGHPVLKKHKAMAVFRTAPVKPKKDLTPEEVGKFLSKLEPGLFRVLAEVQYGLYARIQEAAALHVEDFDPVTGWVEVKRKIVWPRYKGVKPFIQDGLKSSDVKRVRSPYVASLLSEWCRRSGITSGLVFSQEGIIPFRAIQYQYDKAFEAAGLPHRGTHILRHASLTEHYVTGGDLYKTMHVAGHSRIDTTQGYAKQRQVGHDATQLLMDEKLRGIIEVG
jgi:integrase